MSEMISPFLMFRFFHPSIFSPFFPPFFPRFSPIFPLFSPSFFSPGWSTPGAHVHVRRPSTNAVVLIPVGVHLEETIELYKYNQQSLAMDPTVKPRASLYQELEGLEIGRTYEVSYAVWSNGPVESTGTRDWYNGKE
jgi:hypothetical protein